MQLAAIFSLYLSIPISLFTIHIAEGKYLDRTAGNEVILYPFHGGTNQQWKVTSNGDGTYRLNPIVNTGTSLDVLNGTDANWTDVLTYTNAQWDNQKWRIIKIGDGTYRPMPKTLSPNSTVPRNRYRIFSVLLFPFLLIEDFF